MDDSPFTILASNLNEQVTEFIRFRSPVAMEEVINPFISHFNIMVFYESIMDAFRYTLRKQREPFSLLADLSALLIVLK